MSTVNPESVKVDPHQRLFLVDGSGYIFRAYHALPPLTRTDGAPIGAVLGFCNMLSRLLDDIESSGTGNHVAVIFDKGHRTFRNDIYSEYKANREAPPEDLVPQFSFIRDATRAFSVACIEQEGFEADDIIATYARVASSKGYEVIIVSSDKDLMQLVRDGVSMFDPIKSVTIGTEEVRARFGVGPERVVDVQALAGDSTDNVPGIRGIGVKTAAALINEYGDLDTLLDRAEEIKQPKRRQLLLEYANDARMSRELVRLREDVPVEENLTEWAATPPDPDVLFPFLKAMELNTLTTRLRSRLESLSNNTRQLSSEQGIENEYRLVTNAGDISEVIVEARTRGIVAMAVQTDSNQPRNGKILGIALRIPSMSAAYIPFSEHARNGGETEEKQSGYIELNEAMSILKPLFEDPAILKIGHDVKYQMHLLNQHGISLTPTEDIMLLSYVLGAGAHLHTLEAIGIRELGKTRTLYKDVVGSGRAQVPLAQASIDNVVHYQGEAADFIGNSHAPLRVRLVSEKLVNVYESIERPLISVLCRMEQAGVLVDDSMLSELSRTFGDRIIALEREIYGLAGHDFNIGSPRQLGEVLFGEMGLAGGRKTKTGAYGTGADVLENLASEGHELPGRVLSWRQMTKLKSTYTDALQKEINPETGRVHTTYAMTGAATGRLSSNDPNLQNIPVRTQDGRKIRRAFIASPGRALLSADYSQIELRLLAHIASIEPLREAFEQNADIHAITASQVFGLPIEDVELAMRRRAKAINFGIIYGISPFGLARQLDIERAKAHEYIEAYFERYPGIREYMEQTRAICRQNGYVETLYGRRCHLPGIHEKIHARRSFAERAAINAPIQGSAADIIKMAMIRVDAELDKSKLDAEMLLSVHDELIFEVAETQVDDLAVLVKQVMENVAYLSVPLVVDTGSGGSWDEAH